MIPPQHLARSQQLVDGCDVLLVVGTSGMVLPAATLPGATILLPLVYGVGTAVPVILSPIDNVCLSNTTL